MSQYSAGVIDLRLHKPATRLALVEQVLALLRPGEDVLLVFHQPPLRLPTYIEQHYPGRFSLKAVDQGPEIWSLCIQHRREAAAE